MVVCEATDIRIVGFLDVTVQPFILYHSLFCQTLNSAGFICIHRRHPVDTLV